MLLTKTLRQPVRAPIARRTLFPRLEESLRDFFEEPIMMSPFGGGAFNQLTGLMPATDVMEDQNELVLTSELPGMSRTDVSVSVDDGILTIKGEKSVERKDAEERKDYRIVEREYGSFQRSFTLPRTIDSTKVTASMKDGVLTVRLPKTAEAKTNGRMIEITG